MEKDRQARRISLIHQGGAEVSSYLLELKRDDAISDEEYWDSEFNAELKDAVRQGLESNLTGVEGGRQVRKMTRKIIDHEVNR